MRFVIFVIIGGVALGFFGVQEIMVSSGATDVPLDIALADIEKGPLPENTHLRIGAHQAVYGGCVYEYQQSKYEKGPPNATTKLNFCYYPILSDEHPFIKTYDELLEKYGDDESIPDEEYPDTGHISVLVKTDQFKTIGDIPDVGWTDQPNAQGLVINRIKSLDAEETRLIKSSFPSTDMAKVLILELGRKPGAMKGWAMAGGGVLIVLVTIGVAIGRKRAA